MPRGRSTFTKRQKELLQELESGAKVDNKPQKESLMDKVKDMFS